MRGQCALLLAALAWGCSGDEERPPELVGTGVDNPKTCSQIRTGTPQKGRVVLSGEVARCEPDGLACALNDVSSFGGVCDPQKAVEASCEQAFWILTCVERPDAGAPLDAGGAD